MDISIYPNPVSSIVNVSVPEEFDEAEVRIYGINGGLVISAGLNGGKSEIDLTLLKPGIYIMQFISGEWSVNKKIIKE